MGQINSSKKLSIGSISLILSIFGGMFSFTVWDGKCLGEHILSSINISFPFPGMLLVTLISLVILFISLLIGYKYKNDYFVKSGQVIAEVFISIIVILVIANLIIFIF